VVVISLDSSEELRNFTTFEIDVVEGASEVLLRSDVAVDEVSDDEEELLGF
jgi:hypothetical protein